MWPGSLRGCITWLNLSLHWLLGSASRATNQPAQVGRLERDVEFAERQGRHHNFTRGRWIFENAAQWTPGGGIEPRDDPVAILTLQCEFVAARLKYEERQFHATQNYITVQAGYHSHRVGPASPEQAFANLERFQQNVVELRDQLQSKQSELIHLGGNPDQPRRLAKRGSFQVVRLLLLTPHVPSDECSAVRVLPLA